MGYEREEEKALVVKGADFVKREAREWAGEKTKKACLVLHPETFPLLQLCLSEEPEAGMEMMSEAMVMGAVMSANVLMSLPRIW